MIAFLRCRLVRIIAVGCWLAFAGSSLPAQAAFPPDSAPAQRHFVIVLRIVPRLHAAADWTEAEHATLRAHYNYLKVAMDRRQLLLAGRTEEPLDRAFALVVLTAKDESAAREFMNADPCVRGNIMTGEIHPYGLALFAGRETAP